MAKPRRVKTDPLIDRKRLLAEFDMITEQDLAVLLKVDVKTLRNRPLSQLPVFSKTGRERLFHRESVRQFLAANTRGERAIPFRRRKAADEPRAAS